jgi:hypothetical protein
MLTKQHSIAMLYLTLLPEYSDIRGKNQAKQKRQFKGSLEEIKNIMGRIFP